MSTSPRRAALAVVIALAITALFAGCSDGDDDGRTASHGPEWCEVTDMARSDMANRPHLTFADLVGSSTWDDRAVADASTVALIRESADPRPYSKLFAYLARRADAALQKHHELAASPQVAAQARKLDRAIAKGACG